MPEAAHSSGKACLVLAYQPIVPSGRRRCQAWSEALVRQVTPGGQLLSLGPRLAGPGGPELERRIDLVTPCLLYRDLLQCRGLRAALNVSAASLANPDWHHAFEPLISDPRCSGRVILEITERGNIDSLGSVAVDHLRCRGVLIALDDITPDRALLPLMTSVRPDIVKIDKSVIARLCQGDDRDLCMIQSALAGLSPFLVAEGIETSQAYHKVARHGLPYQQGYFHGRPAVNVFRKPPVGTCFLPTPGNSQFLGNPSQERP